MFRGRKWCSTCIWCALMCTITCQLNGFFNGSCRSRKKETVRDAHFALQISLASLFTHHSIVCVSFGFTFSSSSFRHSPHHFLLFLRFTFQQTYDRSFFYSSADVIMGTSQIWMRWDSSCVLFCKITISFSLSINALSAIDFTCWWFNLWPLWWQTISSGSRLNFLCLWQMI